MIKLPLTINKKLTIFFLLALVPFLLPNFIHAQAEIPLVVAPARQYLNLDPGKKQTIQIKFFNNGKDPVYGNIKAVDFLVIGASGSPTLLEEENAIISSRFSAASWVKLPYDKATIAAETMLKLQFEIDVPEDARPGGRYLAVIFEPTGSIPKPLGAETEGIAAVSPRIVGLVNIRVNGPISEMAMVKRLEVPSFVEYGPVDVITEVFNRGDYHITPQGTLQLIDWFGNIIDEQQIKNLNIFPDASRIYENKLGNKLLIGKYKVVFLASYGESGQALSSTASFWAFPWRMVLLIILTITIIILLATLIYQKLKGRQKKLEEKLEEEISEIESLKAKYRDTVSAPTTPAKKTK